MAPASKANYKSFEAQARLIRAMVAAHPDTKWNYKEIVACFGSDMTEAALDHRFRPVRAEAIIISEARKQGLDMKDMKLGDDLPKTQGSVDINNISKYFGQSTADGIQFQFRSIKTDAKRLKEAFNNGEDVANCPLPGINGPGGASAASTPSKGTPSRNTASKGTKRKQTTSIKLELASDFDDDDDENGDSSPQDWSDKDLIETPSKRRSKMGGVTGTPSKLATSTSASTTPRQRNTTPSRRAATKAAATIAAPDATAHLSESFSEPEPPSVAPASIFGNPTGPSINPAFNRGATDSLISGGPPGGFGEDGGITGYYSVDMEDDGEI